MKSHIFRSVIVFCTFAFFAAVGADADVHHGRSLQLSLLSIAQTGGNQTVLQREVSMELQLESTNFENNGTIPIAHTGNGRNVSPALQWKNAPLRTQSYVVIVDDPDAPGGTWVHWVVFDIPASVQKLAEDAGAAGDKNLPAEARHGVNSWFERGLPGGHQYSGPLPPRGQKHRYVFHLYALDVPTLGITESEPTKARITQAMEGRILASAELVGTYQQPEK